ncbi:MAG TPA: hypothetical protein DCX53_10685, partial [Anaerolineae bacterium]|nr:hypothetical protein [Anaerolineae bacterium]
PNWMNASEMEIAREFLNASLSVQKRTRYEYRIDGRDVDFSTAIPISTSNIGIPIWLAKYAGLMKIGWRQVLPAFLASFSQ